MKKCLNCDISIGGKGKSCPLCRNSLSGDETEYMWPPARKLRRQTFLYKLQLFLILAVVATAFVLDYLADLHGALHWSLVLSAWLLSFEGLITMLITRAFFAAKFITIGVFQVGVLLLFTGWYGGFLPVIIRIVIPIMISVMLVLNLIFSLTDKTDNAMVYLLVNIVVAIVPYVIQFIMKGKQFASVAWIVCVIISVITFLGIAVFRGSQTQSEIEKRIHL